MKSSTQLYNDLSTSSVLVGAMGIVFLYDRNLLYVLRKSRGDTAMALSIIISIILWNICGTNFARAFHSRDMLFHPRGPLSDQLPPSNLVKLSMMSLASRGAYHNLFSFNGVGIREDDNSTCQQMTHCSTCVDLLTSEGSGCVWCNAEEGRTADGICLPRSSAQQRCTIEELQVSLEGESDYCVCKSFRRG